MKTTIKLMLLAAISAYCSACSKSSILPDSQVASIDFTNATIGSSPVFVQFNSKQVIFSTLSTSNLVNYGSANIFSPIAGNVTVSCIQSADTTHTLFKGSLTLQNYNEYSFFLTGTASQPDTMFVHDSLPYYPATDSVGGVRFVNLSTSSNPISVDIKGQANGSEAANLSYKQITAFKTYAATYTISSYVFEFRDQATGNLLASYTVSGVNNATGANTTTNTFRFKNHTLALIGQPGGTGAAAQKVILINNY